MIAPGGAAAVFPGDAGPAAPISLRLSPREHEILRLIACDRSDKEIARTLRMSPHTLRTHLSRVYQRYRLHSRAAAVALWLLGPSGWGALSA